MLILDLQSEQFPQYGRLKSYYGQPFIWCMLHNFGGTLGMFGSAQIINQVCRKFVIFFLNRSSFIKKSSIFFCYISSIAHCDLALSIRNLKNINFFETILIFFCNFHRLIFSKNDCITIVLYFSRM